MYRHVFWDLGGTLVDTYPALNHAFVEVVRRHGGAIGDDEVAGLTRQSTGEAIAQLAWRYSIAEAEFERATDDLKEQWAAYPAPAMTGAPVLMGAIAEAGGKNLIVTHRDRASALALLDGLHLPYHDLICPDDGHPRKPDPEMYVVLLTRHGLDPAECLAVGDRAIDAVAAQAAGMAAATSESFPELVDDPAEHSVATLDALRPLLGL